MIEQAFERLLVLDGVLIDPSLGRGRRAASPRGRDGVESAQMASDLTKNPVVVAGALVAAGVAFAVWYQKYNSPYERCVRAAYTEATATRILKVTGDGAQFAMEWSTSEMPSETQIDAALARKRAGESEPIRYAAPKPSELDALTRCTGLLR